MTDYRGEKVSRCKNCGEVFCLADGFCECHREFEDEETEEEETQTDAFLRMIEENVPGWSDMSHDEQLWAMDIFNAGRMSVLKQAEKRFGKGRVENDLH